jgi:DNA polymerase-3 subunit alpha
VAAVTIKPVLQPAEPYDPLVELSLERSSVGFFLSGHPFNEYREVLSGLPVISAQQSAGRAEGSWVDLVGVVTSFRTARDKHKRLYARVHFEDRSGMIELVVYAQLYAATSHLVESDAILVVGGRVQARSDGTREVVADRIVCIDEVLGSRTRRILLELDLSSMGAAGLQGLEDLLQMHAEASAGNDLASDAAGGARPVPVPVFIDVGRGQQRWFLECGRRIVLTLASLRALRGVAGLRNLSLDVVLPAPVKRGSWKGSA